MATSRVSATLSVGNCLSRRPGFLITAAAVALLGAGSGAGAGGYEVSERASLKFPGPTSLTVTGQYVEGAALGFELVQPFLRARSVLFLGEVYGFKGERNLGGMGAGLILRAELPQGGILEANGFFDALQDERGFSYPQVGLGLSYDRGWFAVRANGYLPLVGGEERKRGTNRWSETESKSFGATVQTVNWSRDLFEASRPMRGFDVEAEFGLPKPPAVAEPRVAVGYFYRDAENSSKVYSGLKVRGEVRFAKHWTAGVEWRGDAGEIGQEWRYFVRGEFLFGPGSTTEVVSNGGMRDARMYKRAVREPWPSVARTTSTGKPEEGGRKVWNAPVADPQEDGCQCGEPLVFE